jgi:hypothetical protein
MVDKAMVGGGTEVISSYQTTTKNTSLSIKEITYAKFRC